MSEVEPVGRVRDASSPALCDAIGRDVSLRGASLRGASPRGARGSPRTTRVRGASVDKPGSACGAELGCVDGGGACAFATSAVALRRAFTAAAGAVGGYADFVGSGEKKSLLDAPEEEKRHMVGRRKAAAADKHGSTCPTWSSLYLALREEEDRCEQTAYPHLESELQALSKRGLRLDVTTHPACLLC